MHEPLITVHVTDTVVKVAQQMNEHNLGSILVVENETLWGIFSERDILKRVVAVGKDPATTLVKQVATPNPIVVHENASVGDCARLIKGHGFRHLPVVDANKRPIGIISSRDFLQYSVNEIEDLVNKQVFHKNERVTQKSPFDQMLQRSFSLPLSPNGKRPYHLDLSNKEK